MFDIGWMELMVVGMVMLLVVGPKELPGLLRTIGKYAGMLKKQANEFRAQFDEAIENSEFQDLKKDMENLGEETEAGMRDAENSLNEDLAEFDNESNLDDNDFDQDWVKDGVAPIEEKAAADEAADGADDTGEQTAANGSEQSELETADSMNGSNGKGSAGNVDEEVADTVSKVAEDAALKAKTAERKSEA